MRFRHLLIALFLFSILNTFQAQTENRKDAISWRWNWVNFQYPITDKVDTEDYTTGGEITYGRYLNRWLDLAIPFRFGKAELPLDETGAFIGSDMIGSLGAILQLKLLKSESRVSPYLSGGAGLMMEVDNDAKLNPEFPLGIGLNIKVAHAFYISAESSYRFDLNDNRNQMVHALGVKFDFGNGENEPKDGDRDKDGISDDEDQCPDEPGSSSLYGCPDKDGDGVADRLDDCPNENGPAELGGCPDDDGDKVPNHLDECPNEAGSVENKGCPNNDRDGDGINNEVDKCPDEAGSEYTQGCPDLDSDGIADVDDLCPSQSGLPENKGCPDSDSDGIADPFDKCPNTVGPASNSGCPELKPEEKEVLEFAMQAVQFETGSAKLLSASNEVLDQVADILLKYPGQKLRISGHTDSIGSAEANMELSKRRAKACYDQMIKKGIAKSRMAYQGFGETLPIADNRFSPGREKNRRVEFEIYVE